MRSLGGPSPSTPWQEPESGSFPALSWPIFRGSFSRPEPRHEVFIQSPMLWGWINSASSHQTGPTPFGEACVVSFPSFHVVIIPSPMRRKGLKVYINYPMMGQQRMGPCPMLFSRQDESNRPISSKLVPTCNSFSRHTCGEIRLMIYI